MHLDHKLPWHSIAPHFSLTPAGKDGLYSLAALNSPSQTATLGHFKRVFLATIREFSDTEITKIDSTPVIGKLFSDDVLYFAECHFGLGPNQDNSALHNPLNSSHQDMEYWKTRARGETGDMWYGTSHGDLADAVKMLVVIAAIADDKVMRREALSAIVLLCKEVPISHLQGLNWGHGFGLDLVASVALEMHIFLNLIEAVSSCRTEQVPLLSVDKLLLFLKNHALEDYDFPAQNIPHRAFWNALGVTDSWANGRYGGISEGDKPVIDPLATGSDEVQRKAREDLTKYLKDCFAILADEFWQYELSWVFGLLDVKEVYE
ncbi:hypothetical protein F53441_3615 [Fusarium austroafricanum]|uniref:Uncharacterized protein n=1 Tax=Fusarium austroafricanum TaxID=2364996 RepID=A0A8H4KQK7_9HYPO|nr:hypothetical protein F53441_3615 [Fusarium austroafricanum]